MSRLLAASALLALLSALPATAQPSKQAGLTGAPAPRAVTATGVTKPPGASPMRASTEADMLKAQRASAARDKAWDSKMRTTMGSICKGC